MNDSDVKMIEEIFTIVRGILEERENGKLPLRQLSGELRDRGFERGDVSFALAHLTATGKLSVNGGYNVRVDDPAPFQLAS